MPLSLLAALLVGQAAPLPPVRAHGTVAMPINRYQDADWSNRRTYPDGSWIHPQSGLSFHVGTVGWAVQNAKLDGKAVKLFRGESKWTSRVYAAGRLTDMRATPTIYSFAWVDANGKLLKTQTSLAGLGVNTQIEAIYGEETVDVTTTRGRDVRRSTLYPKFPMDAFRNLYTPLVVDGLPVRQEKECAMIHPATGAPYRFKLKIAGRFQAKMVDAKYEGYYVDIEGDLGRSTAGVTRQGQLLSIQMPDGHGAFAYSTFTRNELDTWGKFEQSDWDRPASLAHPGRKRHQTLIAPVFLREPRILVPVPCALAL